MPWKTVYLWKQAPFLRLIIPFMTGIVLQWYLLLPSFLGWVLIAAVVVVLAIFNTKLSFVQYRLRWINGICINGLILALGILLCYYKNSSHDKNWLNNYYQDKDLLRVTLQEPLSEKPNSYKALAAVQSVFHEDSVLAVNGNIVIYFSKDSSIKQLQYGDQLIFSRPLQAIKNTGNPGSFDYKRYMAFHGVYWQVYLKPGEYVLLPGKNKGWLASFLFITREKVLNILTQFIPGDKEAGLAEALLVGYKDDLDKTLVQSYSNTGVVHVIAISGLHLGLIYWLLGLLFNPLKKKKSLRWLPPMAIITGLWLFALLAGGGPSILRSAVMFTCIVIAQSTERKTNIYNSLAASAFILLCINPFWLWDVGFQLSYSAVLSIVIFMKPVYSWFYFSNKMIDTIWKLSAVTLAAQVLTTPVSIYHFHQFPVYFLITNLLAVPLSSAVILGEILLCIFGWWPMAANFIGKILHWLIALMNGFIEHMENMPASLWNGMQINFVQLILLYATISAISYWMFKKHKPSFIAGLVSFLLFICIRTNDFIEAGERQQLVVYNISKHQAVDFINGRNCVFKGDQELLIDPALHNFHLQPAHTLFRSSLLQSTNHLTDLSPLLTFNRKTIVLVDRPLNPASQKIQTDLIVISKNAPVHIADLLQTFNCPQIVLDASNNARNLNKWKLEAANAGCACISVVDNGAFVMKLD